MYGSTAVDPCRSPLTTLFVVTYGNSTQTRCLMGVLRQQDKSSAFSIKYEYMFA
ncbi:hypothetical protein [Cyanobacterium aponinum]|uniref:hypothetical protein n=1 Tax=Cyanobacterium aponinum TaxID=379064 RepID=UPI0013FDC97A|nr:hypothetical protein [Cyanobacterium aponinum]